MSIEPLGMTEDEARRITERIRATVVHTRESIEKIQRLLTEARDGLAHVALGYTESGWTKCRSVRCAASTLGITYCLFSRKSKSQADEFFEHLRTGAGLEPGNPILVLRNRLAADGSRRLATESPEVIAWFIKSWNAWRQGKTMRILRHKANDAFPEPQ